MFVWCFDLALGVEEVRKKRTWKYFASYGNVFMSGPPETKTLVMVCEALQPIDNAATFWVLVFMFTAILTPFGTWKRLNPFFDSASNSFKSQLADFYHSP